MSDKRKYVCFEKVRVDGKKFTLFKRGTESDDERALSWEVQFARGGVFKRYKLGTPNRKVAEERLKQILRAVLSAQWSDQALTERIVQRGVGGVAAAAPRPEPEPVAGLVTYATLGELFGAYLENPKRPGDDAVKLNVNTMRLVVRTALGTPKAQRDEIDGLSTEVLTGKLVRDYQRAIIEEISQAKERAEEVDEDLDEEALLAPKRRANRYVSFARSLFTEKVIAAYADRGIVLPDLKGFMGEPGFSDAEKVVSEYNPPPAEVIARTFRALEKLDLNNEQEANQYAAVCLACGTGMRKGLACEARWDWFTDTPDGGLRVRSKRRIAKNQNVLELPVLDEWARKLKALRAAAYRAGRTEKDHVLTGHDYERERQTFDRISAWMEGLGWKTKKRFHEFRAYVGSKVAEKYGFGVAALFLQHSSESITRKFYGRYVQLREIKLERFAA